MALRAADRPVVLYADVPHATRFGWPTWVTGDPADPHLDPEAFWSHHLKGTGVDLAALSPPSELDPSSSSASAPPFRKYQT